MKKCSKCGELKEYSEFNKNKRVKCGLHAMCRQCQIESKRAYRKTDKYKKSRDDYYATGKPKENHKKFRDSEHGKKAIKEYSDKYNKTEKGKEVRLGIDRRARAKNPSEYKARKSVDYAIRHKGLNKPTICSLCGVEKEINKIHGHHWSYLEEHWLDVVWCCYKCHSDIHNNKINDILNRQQ